MPVPCWGDFTARERTYLCYHVLSPWSDQLFLFFFFFKSLISRPIIMFTTAFIPAHPRENESRRSARGLLRQ